MTFAERAAARGVETQRARAADEVAALVEAGLAVLKRDGVSGLTVAEVLAEAGLSTRAFYRHFASKDELVLAIYEQDSHRAHDRLRGQVQGARTPRAALEVWIDETLALGFDARRARRTRVLAAEGARVQAEHPAEFAMIVRGVLEPLVEVLAAVPSPDPERDAQSIHAITWQFVVDKLHGSDIALADARAHVLRFALPALGMKR